MSEAVRTDARDAVFAAALAEARERGDRRVGTDHLLLGLLHADSGTARVLGVDLATAHAALDALDRAALASIGLDIEGLRPASVVPPRTRPALTSTARAVLHRAQTEAAHTRSRRVTGKHVLLALLGCERPDPAAELIAQLGLDRSALRERLDLAN